MRCVNERELTIWQFVIVKKHVDVSFSCVCPVIDDKFCHYIVKVLRIHSAIVLWIHSYFDNVMTKFMINTGQTPKKLTSICRSNLLKNGNNNVLCYSLKFLRVHPKRYFDS